MIYFQWEDPKKNFSFVDESIFSNVNLMKMTLP